jgi:hypothetical protein
MTDTLLISATREVRIGFDHPFVIIGERINAVPPRRGGIRSRASRLATPAAAAAPRPGTPTHP